MGFFKKTEIVSVKIIGHIQGISEEDALMNYTVGHIMGGFDGMVHADLLNSSLSPKTVFLENYSNGKTEKFEVKDNSWLYYKLMSKVK